jgi:hypothetical protein
VLEPPGFGAGGLANKSTTSMKNTPFRQAEGLAPAHSSQAELTVLENGAQRQEEGCDLGSQRPEMCVLPTP